MSYVSFHVLMHFPPNTILQIGFGSYANRGKGQAHLSPNMADPEQAQPQGSASLQVEDGWQASSPGGPTRGPRGSLLGICHAGEGGGQALLQILLNPDLRSDPGTSPGRPGDVGDQGSCTG